MVNEFHERTQSELAVPMVAGEDLVGVLNFESFHPRAFTQDQLVLVSFVANQIAMVWRSYLRDRLSTDLSRMYELTRNNALARIYAERWDENAIDMEKVRRCQTPGELRAMLSGAGLSDADKNETMRQWLDAVIAAFRADMGDFWLIRDPEAWTPEQEIAYRLRVFSRGLKPEGEPRPAGWSAYVLRTGHIVCVTMVRKEEGAWKFGRAFWRQPEGQPGRWSDEPEKTAWLPPESVNPSHTKSPNEPILCEIGIPLEDKQHRFGVLWLKYRDTRPRTSDAMRFDSVLLKDAVLVPFLDPSKEGSDDERVIIVPNQERVSPLLESVKLSCRTLLGDHVESLAAAKEAGDRVFGAWREVLKPIPFEQVPPRTESPPPPSAELVVRKY
jgi:GAF domain-containing protein